MQCINFFIYHRYKLPRYILPLRLGYVGSRDYHSDFLNVVFPQFPNCFLPFPLVFIKSFLQCFYSFSGCFSCLSQCFFLGCFSLFPILDITLIVRTYGHKIAIGFWTEASERVLILNYVGETLRYVGWGKIK